MPPKLLEIDALELDLENPRITLASDQRDAMQKILNEQKVRLINLAESIAEKGLNPMDRFLVLQSTERRDRFIVLEGNRRILALKLLKSPSLVASLEMPTQFSRRLQKAATTFDASKIEPIDCYEVSDRAAGNEWLRQRHSGADEGRGIVSWSSIAGARFRGREPALQALDFVLQHGNLRDEEKEKVDAKFPITTLDRLLSTPTVREAIGYDITDKKLTTELPPDEAIKPLKRIVLDLISGNWNVTKLKSKEQQNEYIGQLKSTDRPNLAKKTGKPVAVESITDHDFAATSARPTRRRRPASSLPRINIVPRTCRLNVTTAKIDGIYKELRSLQLSKHVHAISVLLRVFLEMSVDEYLTSKAGASLKYKQPKTSRMIDKRLKDKVEETIDHMVANGADRKDFKGVLSALGDANNPFSIDTLHAYIHNRFFTPTDRQLTTGWDNAQPFFEKIWP